MMLAPSPLCCTIVFSQQTRMALLQWTGERHAHTQNIRGGVKVSVV